MADHRKPDAELLSVDNEYAVRLLLELLAIPSPTGHTEAVTRRLERELEGLGVSTSRTPKGALLWTLEGEDPRAGERAVVAHVDTLGAMVREVKQNGRVHLSRLGGFDWATIEGSECRIHLHSGGELTGTVVNARQSVHVFSSADRVEARAGDTHWEVRLDVASSSAAETVAAGVQVGDFVSFDSSARLTDTGYIKGRHLDDKAAVAVAVAITAAFASSGRKPACTTHFFLSNYEEVGHGAAFGIPVATGELLCLDMAAVGEGQSSHERSVTLCVKDAGGPYDPVLNDRLRRLASENDIPLKVDLYPSYTSDATAAWRAGHGFKAALIGPGVDASHGYERTHRDALEATARLSLAFLLAPPESQNSGSGPFVARR